MYMDQSYLTAVKQASEQTVCMLEELDLFTSFLHQNNNGGATSKLYRVMAGAMQNVK